MGLRFRVKQKVRNLQSLAVIVEKVLPIIDLPLTLPHLFHKMLSRLLEQCGNRSCELVSPVASTRLQPFPSLSTRSLKKFQLFGYHCFNSQRANRRHKYLNLGYIYKTAIEILIRNRKCTLQCFYSPTHSI